MPGVWDALSARLAAGAGFDAVFLSGYAVAGAMLGLPDIGLLTQTEMADVARRVCGAVPEHDRRRRRRHRLRQRAATSARTVELWEAAGAAGLFLEDQVWPKRCGHMAGKQVVPTRATGWPSCGGARPSHAPVRDGAHRRPAPARARRGDRRARRRRLATSGSTRCSSRRPSRSPSSSDRRRRARVRARRQHGRDGQDPVADARPSSPSSGSLSIVSPLSRALRCRARPCRRRYGALRTTTGSLRDDLDRLVSFEDFTDLVDLERHQAMDERYGGRRRRRRARRGRCARSCLSSGPIGVVH